MSLNAVTVVAALSALGGWYGRGLWQAVQDVAAARARLAGALKALWKARWIFAGVAFAIAIAADWWMRRHG